MLLCRSFYLLAERLTTLTKTIIALLPTKSTLLLANFLLFFVYRHKGVIQVNLYEKITFLASKNGISIRRLEEELGFANATIRRWDKSKPSVDKIKSVADFFHVSVDFLLDRKSHDAFATELKEQLEKTQTYDGRVLSERDLRIIKSLIASYMTNRYDIE